ncbi:hypothetical protein GJV82_02695 [Cellulosimicrobium sp. BIT-GX5]|uniref:Uncharacterized protein n=1 Tax=Cellulosimicrobium composti TaxID=2672572 RepID=A0A6N7ZEJ7_9MICO|nr:hypothetical protein [Cellulosimicrobium composti]MTG87867.1 hypothetical protein [Cellulosimicrobium composti]
MGRRARITRSGAVLTLAVALASTAGCTVASHQEPGQATAAVADAVAQAGSAVATTRLTVSLLDADRVTTPVADAAVLDQVRVLEESTTALTTLVPPDDVSSAQRDAGLAAVADATAEVVTARAWVAREAGGDLSTSGAVPLTASELEADLARAADDLDAVLALAGGA